MSDLSDITTVLRYMIEDFSRSQVPGDIFTYTTSSVFTLSEPNAIAILQVLKNNVALSSSNYSYDSTSKKVTISASLTSGDTIEIQYTYYSNFSDTELSSYLQSAVVYLSVNNYYTFTVDSNSNLYPSLTDKEKNFLAYIATLLINKPVSSYRLPDLSLAFPENLSLQDKISKAVRVFKSDTHGVFDIVSDITLPN